MRLSLLVASGLAALGFLGGPVLAGSIDTVKSLPKGAQVDSITHVACPQCKLHRKPVAKSYDIPSLKPGEQRVELKMVKGEQKIVRTEAWLGGSPVTFVSDATPELIAGYFPNRDNPAQDGIDEASKTAAVGDAAPLAVKDPVAASTAGALDLSGFRLRKD